MANVVTRYAAAIDTMQPLKAFHAGGRRFEFPGTVTYVMGVINMSPESRNRHTVASTVDEALEMARSYRRYGATLIDLGAQSSHFENVELSVDEELTRLLPALKAMVEDGFVVAVDTWKPEVAAEAVNSGAAIINDTGGLQDPRMAEVVRSSSVPAVFMHIEGSNPLHVEQMEFTADKAAIMAERFRPRLVELHEAGINDLILDPGLSINYRSDYRRYSLQQMEVIRGLGDLRGLGHPVLIPVPRKQEFSRVMAYTTLALEYGADVIRVHDVEAACSLVQLYGREART